MNDKCCLTCEHNDTWCKDTPILWDNSKDYCSRYSPLSVKPWKIEPLTCVANELCLSELKNKINELISAWNGRDK